LQECFVESLFDANTEKDEDNIEAVTEAAGSGGSVLLTNMNNATGE